MRRFFYVLVFLLIVNFSTAQNSGYKIAVLNSNELVLKLSGQEQKVIDKEFKRLKNLFSDMDSVMNEKYQELSKLSGEEFTIKSKEINAYPSQRNQLKAYYDTQFSRFKDSVLYPLKLRLIETIHKIANNNDIDLITDINDAVFYYHAPNDITDKVYTQYTNTNINQTVDVEVNSIPVAYLDNEEMLPLLWNKKMEEEFSKYEIDLNKRCLAMQKLAEEKKNKSNNFSGSEQERIELENQYYQLVKQVNNKDYDLQEKRSKLIYPQIQEVKKTLGIVGNGDKISLILDSRATIYKSANCCNILPKIFAIMKIRTKEVPMENTGAKIKIAYLNSREFLEAQSITKSARENLIAFTNQFATKLEEMHKEIDLQNEQLSGQASADYTEEEKLIKEKYIVTLNQQFVNYQIQAQNKIAQKEKELLQPINGKAQKSLEKYAIENNIDVILEQSSGLILHASDNIVAIPFFEIDSE